MTSEGLTFPGSVQGNDFHSDVTGYFKQLTNETSLTDAFSTSVKLVVWQFFQEVSAC